MNQLVRSFKLLLASCLSLVLFGSSAQPPGYTLHYPKVQIRYSTPSTNGVFQNNLKILVKSPDVGTTYYLVYASALVASLPLRIQFLRKSFLRTWRSTQYRYGEETTQPRPFWGLRTWLFYAFTHADYTIQIYPS